MEVDKMNRAALKSHFDAYVGNLLARLPRRAASRGDMSWRTVTSAGADWTDGFAAKFQQRYGYDPIRFLPVLTGRMVGSAEQSNRFLWDMRRMVADGVAMDYVGGLRDLCHQNGLKCGWKIMATGVFRVSFCFTAATATRSAASSGKWRPRQHRTP